MYTILFSQDKELIQTVRIPLFKGERNITDIRFLISQQIEDMDTQSFKVLLRYQFPTGKKYAVNLIQDPEPYRSYYSYTYPVTADLTKESGYIYYSITLQDSDGNIVYKSDTDVIEVRERAKESISGGEIIWEPDKALFPYPGSTSVLYIDTGADKIYRWDETKRSYEVVGSDYTDIVEIEDGDVNG